jgi:hypothetical protein
MEKETKTILYIALALVLLLFLISAFDISFQIYEDFSFKLAGCVPFGPCYYPFQGYH